MASGLELEGTPALAIEDTFNVGIADTNQIISNANRRSKSIMSNAFNSAMSGIASSVGMAAMGGFGGGFDAFGSGGASTFGSQGALSRVAKFGSASAQGPIQGWGGF